MTGVLIVLILFASFAVAPALRLQRHNALAQQRTANSSLPTADEVLDRYVQSLGGKAALEKIASRSIKGSITWNQLSGVNGNVEQYFKTPDKYMSVTTAPGFGTTREGFTGSSGWSIGANGNQRDWASHEVTAAKLYRDFARELRLKANYPTITFAGKEKIGSKETYVLELTRATGKPERMYFDVATGLLLLHEYEVPGPQFTQPFEYYYEDYREVDGVKVAFTIRRVQPSAYTIKLSEVKHNVDIADEQFNKPAAK